ncbi:MAG: hypothetical protein QOE66_1343 [Chloroflexota bacterium]|nr:hypothetical protein [Chloroflexota bacterium]
MTRQAGAERVPAVGGRRTVPVPDPIARDYILLGLRLDHHIPGLLDGYFGPADLKAQVDTEQLRMPARLRDDATALRGRVANEVTAPDRRAWLEAQLVALETQAAALAGEVLPYLEHVARCFAAAPRRAADAVFDAAAMRIEALLPGDASLADRLEAWDARFEVPPHRLPGVLDWLVSRFRATAAADFGLPDGEDLRVSLVSRQPWSAYNWFDGGRHSRVDINTDLPVPIADLIGLVAHEAYPGHHVEHAWKEADLVDERGRLEASILLINTPECLISEGLADLGQRFASPPEMRADLLLELYDRAGLPIAADPAEARIVAETTVALGTARETLGSIRGNAAILRHADGRSHDEVLAYLQEVGRYAPASAAKRLEFIEHPLWRTYVFVYAEGQALLERWLAAVPEADRAARFGRLLHEQLTPEGVTTPG